MKTHLTQSKLESYWVKETKNNPLYPSLEEDIQADITIVGGGITGILAAYLLAEENLDIVLIESGRLMNGTTGHTTAKITTQHDLIYDELITNLGSEKAKLYYESNRAAINFYKETIEQLNICCDYQEETATLYATTDESKEKVLKEAEAYEKLGIPGKLKAEIPLDIPIQQALSLEKQAQFHPLKFLNKLLEILITKGVRIYENTTVTKIDEGSQGSVETREGKKVKSNHILIATHFPFPKTVGLYAARLKVERSYVLAAKTDKPYPGGMYLQVDQSTRSLRKVNMDGQELVLIGGMSHQTGKVTDTRSLYEDLASFGNETLGLKEIPYHWSAQDLITLDKIPYIGKFSPTHSNIRVATGFRKWGMTNSFVSAKLFYDYVMNKGSKFAEIYSPSRFQFEPSISSLAENSSNMITSLAKGKLEKPNETMNALETDEGAVITYKGKRKGAYKDKDGKLYLVDTTCTHLGCEVNWNNGDRTWDCPCHGSRYDYTGAVIEGPATEPLKQENIESND